MPRRSLTIGLLCLAACFAACTREYSFVVVNESETPVVVEYEFAPMRSDDGGAPPRYLVRVPEMETPVEIFGWRAEWQALPSTHATIDERRGIVRIDLEPKRSFRVAHVFDYRGEESWRLQVNVVRLTITGAAGRAEYTGDQVRKSFVESDGAYVLAYR